ncbi:MAG: hypothetical protein IPF53_21525 [Blastocatellia bacterium]|nr:hypothetical protein [Blastocatellia bacterium]
MMESERLGLWWSLAVAALILVAQVVWGGLFEGRRWAVPLELARIGAIFGIAMILVSTNAAPWQVGAAVGVACAGFAVAVLRLGSIPRVADERAVGDVAPADA